ncbi:MAG: EscU/YscU/HrcU family type III secretion system export apparatus switch protein [Gemmatimonadaceae bacterium]|nr:EscU/YscU/HrcU family type III secretion system export apparatus switch protein [Gemmatimonadaceae bacterium]
MADDTDKTEAPSGKRLEDEREKGNIPRSPEFTTAAMLFGAAVILTNVAPAMGKYLTDTMSSSLYNAGANLREPQDLLFDMIALGWRTLGQLSLLIGAFTMFALISTALQSRGILSTKPLEPSFKKLNPLTNLKRLLGTQGLAELVKSVVKLAIIGSVVYSAVDDMWRDVLGLAQGGPMGVAVLFQRHAIGLLRHAGIAFVALGVADYGFQWWRWHKSLMMSKQEVKDEARDADGDPMNKQRIRSAQRALSRKRMMSAVPTADVVIVNPIHIAVAIKYDPMVAPAPIIVAIGQRMIAERIKKIAFENGVPVVENIPVARALLASKAAPGTQIPLEMYVAVAEVLAFVMRQKAKFGRSWSGTHTIDD